MVRIGRVKTPQNQNELWNFKKQLNWPKNWNQFYTNDNLRLLGPRKMEPSRFTLQLVDYWELLWRKKTLTKMNNARAETIYFKQKILTKWW